MTGGIQCCQKVPHWHSSHAALVHLAVRFPWWHHTPGRTPELALMSGGIRRLHAFIAANHTQIVGMELLFVSQEVLRKETKIKEEMGIAHEPISR